MDDPGRLGPRGWLTAVDGRDDAGFDRGEAPVAVVVGESGDVVVRGRCHERSGDGRLGDGLTTMSVPHQLARIIAGAGVHVQRTAMGHLMPSRLRSTPVAGSVYESCGGVVAGSAPGTQPEPPRPGGPR